MENLEIFEEACNYFSQNINEFKDILSVKLPKLKKSEWIYDKGTTKVCQPDETGKKKRCKVGIEYGLKVELSAYDMDIIWNEFKTFFEKSYTSDMERISNNEELGRYEFVAKNAMGDEITCGIYLPNDWNIPQINILGFISARYRSVDYVG